MRFLRYRKINVDRKHQLKLLNDNIIVSVLSNKPQLIHLFNGFNCPSPYLSDHGMVAIRIGGDEVLLDFLKHPPEIAERFHLSLARAEDVAEDQDA